MSSLLCLGNFGTGRKEQYQVSQLMKELCSKECKLILGLGNNIYPDGVESIDDELFLDKFEIPYKILSPNIKFFNILGNRDYNLKQSPQVQINYSEKSFRWIMPHNFYCFIKKFNNTTVEFLAIDTNLDRIKNKNTQEKWAINTLLESKARWRIVFGHHPWKSFGKDLHTMKESSCKLDMFYQKLVDTEKVDLIISGHENSQQHIYIPEKPNMIISGVGGYKHFEKDVGQIVSKELKFRSIELGCVKIDIDKNQLHIKFFNLDRKIIYEFKISKL